MSGSGSQGKTLGRFMLRNKNIFVKRHNRNMYFRSYSGDKYINKDNFVELCMPCIMLNGHYSGTEEALQSTLVHEMVHYYDYMFGRCPKQGHGPGFRKIASMVSSRSNGMFTVQRLASAEVMSNYKLDDDMREKRDKRITNKKAKSMVIFVYRCNGEIEMTIVSNTNKRIPEKIRNYYKRMGSKVVKEIIVSTDPELIDMLYSNGFGKVMRTWRYWNVEKKPWAKDIKKYDYDYLLKSEDMNESKEGIRRIVESVINEYINNIDDDDIRVGDIDLELRSPLEGLEL
jgi:predicted SprT family Zn-dependent metalloprotease